MNFCFTSCLSKVFFGSGLTAYGIERKGGKYDDAKEVQFHYDREADVLYLSVGKRQSKND